MKQTIVYVDGLNLYYGALRKTKYKWLDLMALSNKLLGEGYDIVAIKYFTARVRDFDKYSVGRKQTASDRQMIYIRALEQFIPKLSVQYGRFTQHKIKLISADPKLKRKKVPVIKNEEKGSDVNLAVHLLNDAWLDKYQAAMVISNDSDLKEALKLVKEHHRKEIILANPHDRYPSKDLKNQAKRVAKILPATLSHSQLPNKILNTNLHKPLAWK